MLLSILDFLERACSSGGKRSALFACCGCTDSSVDGAPSFVDVSFVGCAQSTVGCSLVCASLWQFCSSSGGIKFCGAFSSIFSPEKIFCNSICKTQILRIAQITIVLYHKHSPSAIVYAVISKSVPSLFCSKLRLRFAKRCVTKPSLKQ